MQAHSDERILAMLKGRRSVRRIPMPGMPNEAENVPEIGVRILLEEEIDDARVEAVQYVHGKAKALRLKPEDLLDGDPELLGREHQRQIVYRSMIDPDTADADKPKPFFFAVKTLRQMDSVMLETLWQVYVDHQQTVNPLRALGEVDAEELADALGKGTEGSERADSLLSLFDAPTLRTFVRSLAAQLRSARAGK